MRLPENTDRRGKIYRVGEAVPAQLWNRQAVLAIMALGSLSGIAAGLLSRRKHD